jgi:hypothetical protein
MNFWPPSTEKASVRFWALVCSVALNAGLIVTARFFPDFTIWFFLPGVISVVLVTGLWLSGLNPLHYAFVVLINLGFYYFIADLFITAFRHAANWRRKNDLEDSRT